MENQITRQEFEAQTKILKRILDILEGRESCADLNGKVVWDNSDLKRYLHISDSTIVRGTKDGTFKPFLVGKRPRYYRDDILPLRDRFLK